MIRTTHVSFAARIAFALALIALPARAQGTYASRTASSNLVGTTLTNYGSIGNNFVNRAPSLEYPLGGGYEHLVAGGLWIGAHATDANGAFTGVTTGYVDAFTGGTLAAITEFTPVGNAVSVRSALPNSPYFDPMATSEMDYFADWNDLAVKTVSGQVHRPLGVSVHLAAYSWSFARMSSIFFLDYCIANAGTSALTDVWAGLMTGLQSGNKTASISWPPSAGWYSRAWLQYDVAQRLLREHYCANSPVPGSCNLAAVPYWVGVQLLTAPQAGQSVTLGAWNYAPGALVDTSRYTRMSAGTIANVSQAPFLPPTGDPQELLAVGPWASLAPGDSVHVVFALVGGPDEATIRARADTAQWVYDNHWIATLGVPAPPRSALAIRPDGASPAPGALRLAITSDRAGPVRAELLDVAGRRAWSRELALDAAGERTVRVDATLAPGVYLARVTQGRREAVTRVVVLR